MYLYYRSCGLIILPTFDTSIELDFNHTTLTSRITLDFIFIYILLPKSFQSLHASILLASPPLILCPLTLNISNATSVRLWWSFATLNSLLPNLHRSDIKSTVLNHPIAVSYQPTSILKYPLSAVSLLEQVLPCYSIEHPINLSDFYRFNNRLTPC